MLLFIAKERLDFWKQLAGTVAGHTLIKGATSMSVDSERYKIMTQQSAYEVYVQYRRTGFNYMYLFIANCEY